jgi:hypothetical protein
MQMQTQHKREMDKSNGKFSPQSMADPGEANVMHRLAYASEH